MQPGRGRGGAALRPAEDRLIAFAVACVFGDVGRQRNLAQFVQIGIDRLGKLDVARAGWVDRDDGGGQRSISLNGRRFCARRIKRNDDVSLHIAAAGQALPQAAIIVEGAQQEDLNRAAGRFVSMQTCGDDTGIVGDEDIAGAQIVADVGKATVFDAPICAVQHHQATAVARLCRLLGDILGGQFVVEKIG